MASTLIIKDLALDKDLGQKEMSTVHGGSSGAVAIGGTALSSAANSNVVSQGNVKRDSINPPQLDPNDIGLQAIL